MIDPRVIRVALWSEQTKGDGKLCGEQFPSKKAFRADQLWSSSLGCGDRVEGKRCSVDGCAVESLLVVSIFALSIWFNSSAHARRVRNGSLQDGRRHSQKTSWT